MRNSYQNFIAGWNKEGRGGGSNVYVNQSMHPSMAYLGEGGMYVAVGQQMDQMIPGSELSDMWPLVK